MTFSVRQMAVEDLPAVFAVRVSTLENSVSMAELRHDHGITAESMATAMAGDVRGWLAEAGGKIMGFAMGDQPSGEVLVLAVLPKYEGRGIGRAVLQRVEDYLFEGGRDSIWLYTGAEPGLRAYQFYLHLGWRATGELDEDDDDELFVKHRE